MNIEEFRTFCLHLPETTEEFPFNDNVLVFKVGGKLFALTDLSATEFYVNLKCDPNKAQQLREESDSIRPGFHMNKTHWNTVDFEADLADDFLQKMILHSYVLVATKLTQKKQQELNLQEKIKSLIALASF